MKIFISHSSRDTALIREILGHLPTYLQRWFDEEQLLFGMNLDVSIRNAIRDDVDYVIIFLSGDAIASDWVEREFRWALKREQELGRTFVLPVVLEDVWDQVRPVKFQNRKFLSCYDQSKRAVAEFADKLKDELAAWLSAQFKETGTQASKKLHAVPLTGTWRSRFTWTPVNERDSGESSDMIDVEQQDDIISGVSREGNYEYSFRGRVAGDYVMGEWEGRNLPLFGVFQLRINIDTGKSAAGYWIGNGAQQPYHGEWTWERTKPSPSARRRKK